MIMFSSVFLSKLFALFFKFSFYFSSHSLYSFVVDFNMICDMILFTFVEFFIVLAEVLRKLISNIYLERNEGIANCSQNLF